jgi:hypothetical protein
MPAGAMYDWIRFTSSEKYFVDEKFKFIGEVLLHLPILLSLSLGTICQS